MSHLLTRFCFGYFYMMLTVLTLLDLDFDILMIVHEYLMRFNFIDDRKRKVQKLKKYLAKYRECSMVCLVIRVSNIFLFYQIHVTRLL